MDEELLIYGGTLVDPSQGKSGPAALLCRGGKIKSVLRSPSDEDIEALKKNVSVSIDAKGQAISPGFIDIHMHEDPYDAEKDILDKSIARSMALMGVTSMLGGNCGDNLLDPEAYLDIVDRKHTASNIALLAGHTYLRQESGGTDKFSTGGVDKYSHIDDEMLKTMIHHGERCLQAGCFGISFGVKYVPGTEWKEISGLASLCRGEGLLVSSHVRDDVDGVYDAAEELARIGRECGVHVQFSHIGSMGGYGQMPRLLKQIEGYRDEGIDMMCDCYPYDAFSTAIGETTYDEGFLESYRSDYDHIELCDGPYAGKRCTKEIFDLLRREAPETMTIGYFMRQEDVDLALMKDYVMPASDGIRNGNKGHPRAAGTFPRFLHQYAVKGRLSLEEAISRMTYMPAKRIGLKHKGSLMPGFDADIVIFDPERIRDRATYEEPVLAPEGISHVIIGGKIAAKDGVLIRDDLGRALRYN